MVISVYSAPHRLLNEFSHAAANYTHNLIKGKRMQSSDESVSKITMFTKGADGVWLPVIMDPMGDADREKEIEQYLEIQRVERQTLESQGEKVLSYTS